MMTVWMTNDGSAEVIVAAPSKAAAARAMNRGIKSFNDYASDLPPSHPIAIVALARPGIALTRSNRRPHADADGWVEL